MRIDYKEINDEILAKLCEQFEWAGEICFGGNTFSLAALDGDFPVGFIFVIAKNLAVPLENEMDAYIKSIVVDERYRRMGIARQLVLAAEKWASENGFSQIRTWSTDKRVETIPMWRSMGYCMCPATIWLEQYKEAIDGYYVVKRLMT